MKLLIRVQHQRLCKMIPTNLFYIISFPHFFTLTRLISSAINASMDQSNIKELMIMGIKATCDSRHKHKTYPTKELKSNCK